MYELTYSDRKNAMVTVPVDTLKDAEDRAAEIFRANALYATYRPMVRVYEASKMVAIFEGRVSPDGAIRAYRKQTVATDGTATDWTKWTRI